VATFWGLTSSQEWKKGDFVKVKVTFNDFNNLQIDIWILEGTKKPRFAPDTHAIYA
jgi:hypothetical protein